MATQKVKVEGERGGVTRVVEIRGARRSEELYIDRCNLGGMGEVIEVPEFWVEDSEGDAAKKYWNSVRDNTPCNFGDDEQDMTPDRNATDDTSAN